MEDGGRVAAERPLGAEHSRRWRDEECAAWPSSGYRPPMLADRVSISGARPHLSVIHPPVPAPDGLFNGLIWPKDGCASSAYATTAGPDFPPLPTPTPRAARDPGSPSFLAKQQSRARAVLRCAAVAILTPSRQRDGDPEAMWRRSPSASRSPSRPQWCGLRRQDGDGTWPPSAPSRRPAPTSSPATS